MHPPVILNELIVLKGRKKKKYWDRHFVWKGVPKNLYIKGTISGSKIPKFTVFPNPQIFFFHFQRELHCKKLPIQQFLWKQHISGNRDNPLLLGIIFRWRKLIQASISSNKSFKF